MPDPRNEIDLRVDRLRVLISEDWMAEAKSEAERGYNAMAYYAWMLRVRPELLAELDPEGVVEQARAFIDQNARQLLNLDYLQAAPDGAEWLREAELLENSYDEWEPTDENGIKRATLAQKLLDQLDMLQLAVWSEKQLHRCVGFGSYLDSKAAFDMEDCAKWVTAHLDAFLSASVWIQGIGQTIRPDLVPEEGEVDPERQRSARKFANLLERFEEVEDWWLRNGPPPGAID